MRKITAAFILCALALPANLSAADAGKAVKARKQGQTVKKNADKPPATFSGCVADARRSEREKDLAAAEQKLSVCAGMMPRNAKVRLERADILERLGKYAPAIEEYQQAAALFGKKDAPDAGAQALAAVCHIRTAKAWLKLGDRAKTVQYYEKALEIKKNDLNAMFGLAEAYESNMQLPAAAALYGRVLEIEPSNAKAKERLDDLNFNLSSNAEILAELKERKAVDGKEAALSDENLKTAQAMRLAEKRGAIELLKSRAPSMVGFTVSKQAQGRVKVLLTLAGFNAYQRYMTRDAVAFFEKNKIKLKDVFALRDLKGAPIFDSAGKLTTGGLAAYLRGSDGNKTWLMPYETVASTPAEETGNRETEQAVQEGYKEISDSEFSWLLSATDCPADVLTEKPREIIRLIKTPKRERYFLCYTEGSICSTKGTIKLALYIENYRRGDTRIPEGKATAFFGSRPTPGRRFCYKGKIWMGD